MKLYEKEELFIAEIDNFSEEEWQQLCEYLDNTFGARWREYRIEEVEK